MSDTKPSLNAIKLHQKKLLQAYQEYLHLIGSNNPSHLPNYYPYEFSRQVKNWKWNSCGNVVASDLPEIINCLNAWNKSLKDWSIWMKLISQYQISDPRLAWSLSSQFLNNSIYFCMMQPASMLDRLLKFSTLSAHAINLSTIKDYRDWLPISDEKLAKKIKNNKNPTAFFLSKKEKFNQINEIFPRSDAFNKIKKNLTQLNDENYIQKTINWRNGTTHNIPQHYASGHTNIYTRTIEHPHKKIKNETDGLIKSVEDTSRFVASYSLGFTEPMNIQQSFTFNSEQFFITRRIIFLIEWVLFDFSKKNNHENSIKPHLEQ